MWVRPNMVLLQMLKTTEEQVSTEYPAEQQYICMQGQHQKFENTLQFLYQKKTEEIKELKQIWKCKRKTNEGGKNL